MASAVVWLAGRADRHEPSHHPSFGRLVRMPNTPLRYDRLHRSCRVGDGDDTSREELPDPWPRVSPGLSWDEYLATQLLAAADYRSAPVVVALAREGFRYDGCLPATYAARLAADLAAAGLLSAAICAAKPQTHEFPFSFVQTPVSPGFLFAQYEASLQARDRGYCLGDSCRQCGACVTPAERAALVRHPRVPEVPRAAVAASAAHARQTAAATRVPHRAAWPGVRRPQCRLGLGTVAAGVPGRLSAGGRERAQHRRVAVHRDGVRRRTSSPACGRDGRRCARLEARGRAPGPRPGRAAAGVVLGAIEACEPGGFAAATWRLEVPGGARVASRAVESWLRSAHLAFTLRCDADTRHFELAPAALRKRAVSALVCRPAGSGAEVLITFHPKANLRALVASLEPACGAVLATCIAYTLSAARG